VPDLSGCYSCGNTTEEAKTNIKEAIELFIETSKDEGIEIPAPGYFEAELIEVDE
jgi:predicted RNase H-like HicB family nuclease